MKRPIYLYVNSVAIEILKSRRVNISAFVSSLLEVEAGIEPTEENKEAKLRIQLAKVMQELKEVNERKEKKEEKKKNIIKLTDRGFLE